MSNLPIVQDETSDISDSEMIKVKRYIEDGLPGIGEITNSDLYRMLDLYLGGSTYSQIANTLETKKVIVLYLAHTNNWYVIKKEYLGEIQEKIKNRVVDSKLRSQEFMLLLVQAWQKRIGKKLTRYLSTNDDEHMDNVDLKEVTQLMKAIEMVNELDNTGKNLQSKASPIGLNLGNGVTVEKTSDNKITITPKETSIGDLLKQHADAKREEDKKPISDIIVNVKGDKDDN